MGKQDDGLRMELLQEWSEPNKTWSYIEPLILEQRERVPVCLSQSRETLVRVYRLS